MPLSRTSKPQKFTIPLTLGAIFSAIGFLQRSLLASGKGNVQSLYTLSTMFILGAGPTYAGADYFICGRLFSFVPSAAPMSPIRVVRTFITFDVLAEVCVWTGAGLLAGAQTDTAARYKIGLNLIRAAMITQAFLFTSFVAILASFHVRVCALRAEWSVTSNGGTGRRFMMVVYSLYASSIFIIIRSAYHIAGISFFQLVLLLRTPLRRLPRLSSVASRNICSRKPLVSYKRAAFPHM